VDESVRHETGVCFYLFALDLVTWHDYNMRCHLFGVKEHLMADYRLTIRIPTPLNQALDKLVAESNRQSPGAHYTKTGIILALVAKGMPPAKGAKQ
jgi:hypothetical protein